MLSRPAHCLTCPLNATATGFMIPEGHPRLGVTFLGEALGEEEAKQGGPFRGRAGFRFEKMIEHAGYRRDQFQILNAVSCQPPNNSEPETQAIEHCRPHWEPLVKLPETKVIVPMGNVPLYATLGMEGILSKRGYVWWSDEYQAYILPTVHPSYIMRGNHNWEAAWLYDLRHAVDVAAHGWTPVVRDNLLDPAPNAAWVWAKEFAAYLVLHPNTPLGTDIETPDKGTAEDEVDINLGYLAGPIYRIGFGYVSHVPHYLNTGKGFTRTMTIPWTPSHLPVIKFLLSLVCPKIFHYRHFDVPRIKAHGVDIAPDIHDGAEAWHTLHSDLPKKLEHVTPFLNPNQPAWKHLNEGETQAFYNATDAGVQVENFIRLMELLKQHGMWELYERDIFGLNPILIYMNSKGMPVNTDRRKEASLKCARLLEEVKDKLNEAAQSARPNKVYVRKPKDSDLEEITLEKEENYCTECGKRANKKHIHFKCGAAAGEVPLGELAQRKISIVGWVKPLDFSPSQQGLVRYAKFRGYKLITVWDRPSQTRKVTMDETAVRKYALAHPEDKLWPLALEQRELKKLLGTYIGKLTDAPEKPVKRAEEEWWAAFRAAETKAAYYPAEGTIRDRNPVHRKPTVYNLEDDDSIPF